MRKLALFLLFAFSLSAYAQTDVHKTIVTRWAGPGEPMTYAEYLALHPPQPLRWAEIERRTSGLDETGPVMVIVEDSILTPLQTEIDRYLDDLTDAGWEPILLSMLGGTPADLRGILQGYWASDSILGATLVGDLPMPWFELYEDFDNDGIPDNPWQVQFPCDLYYMDLDGDWYDGDLDDVLDTHLNAWQPDIFVGQLIASPLGDEVALISNYFDKNHAFRSEQLYLPGLGLAYIDDDWSGGAGQWGAALAQACGLVEVIGEPDSTTAAGYLDHLDDGYYAILLAAHSSPAVHQFTEQGGTAWNNVYNWQIAQVDPHSYFYNLFCCSGCRYNEFGYIGGWYTFGDTYGQGAVGSTKTGSMLYFEDYYGPMEEGECVGEALRLWFAQHGQEPGSIMWSMSWFYGMTHLGDPTLYYQIGVEVVSVEILDDGSFGSSGDGDGVPDAGETVAINLTMENHDQSNHEGVWVRLSSNSSYVSWLTDSVYVGTLPASGMAVAQGFLLSINDSTSDSSSVTVSVEVRDGASGLWGDTFDLTLRAPDLVLVSYDLTEVFGNGDPYANPGEIFDVGLSIMNQGGDDSAPSLVVMTSVGANWVLSPHGAAGLAELLPGETGEIYPALMVEISQSCPWNYAEPIKVTIGEGGTAEFEPRFLFQTGDLIAWADSISDPDEALVHYSMAEGFVDQWHVSTQRSVSEPYALKFGGTTAPFYAPMADGALELPLFRMGTFAELRFNHWMAVESGYDGGIVEINTGSGWQLLTPGGGYPGDSRPNGSYPGGPCYNGEFEWSPAVFNLGGYGPFVRLRFRFGSDGGVQDEGWYIDDLSLSGELIPAVGETPGSPQPVEFTLGQNYPNPFNAETVIPLVLSRRSQVKVTVYDLAGRKVSDLWDGILQAGAHRIRWNTRSASIPSGIYVLKVEATGLQDGRRFSAADKLLLLK